MPAESRVGRRFRVGLVVLVALFAVMIGVFMVGKRANLFTKRFPYETLFDSASGLVPGNPVRLNGVTVGNVLEVRRDPERATAGRWRYRTVRMLKPRAVVSPLAAPRARVRVADLLA